MENWLEKVQPDLDVDISPALSCLLLQIILQGIGNSIFNSHTLEGWWLPHYPWWNSQLTINMYFQAKNHHSFLLSDSLRQKSYLLWLECAAFSTALWLWLRIGLCSDWYFIAAVFWTTICSRVSRTSVSSGRKRRRSRRKKKVVCRETAIFVSLKELNLLSLTLSVMLI